MEVGLERGSMRKGREKEGEGGERKRGGRRKEEGRERGEEILNRYEIRQTAFFLEP